jgi:hypothetical protein
MHRIVAVTACAAMLAGITFAASAANCDQRIAGSCPIEPIVEQADATAETAPVKPSANARAGKERNARRARLSSRHPSRAERRRTAAAVAKAMAREQARVRVAPQRQQQPEARPQRQQAEAEPQQRVQVVAASPVNATAPAVTAILSPTFIQTTDLRAPKLEAGSLAVADAPAQATAAAEPAAAATSPETTGQAAPEPPASGGADAADAGPPRSEPIQAAASAPSGPADAPWLRFAVIAFGGLLAFGSAIRLFV